MDPKSLFFPTDVLLNVAKYLAEDGDIQTFRRLCYRTSNNVDLSRKADAIKIVPFIVDVECHGPNDRVVLPFADTKVCSIKIDWGDGSDFEIVNRPKPGEIEHKYAKKGIYTIRLHPHGPSPGADGVWLDSVSRKHAFIMGSFRVIRLRSLGSLGIKSINTFFCGVSVRMDYSSLPHLDTSEIQDMEALFFENELFNTCIDSWDVSNVRNMSYMFYDASGFNQPLNSWNTSNVRRMDHMFAHAKKFDQPLDKWDVSNVETMQMMFSHSGFNHPIGNWNVSKVVDMAGMFLHARRFDQNIETWDVSKVVGVKCMFQGATSFNSPLGKWNTRDFVSCARMFEGATRFNQPLNSWNFRYVSDLSNMFSGATSFNQPLDRWNVRYVVSFNFMFAGATSFNQPLDCWMLEYDRVCTRGMFYGATSFKQDLESWNLPPSEVSALYLPEYGEVKRTYDDRYQWSHSWDSDYDSEEDGVNRGLLMSSHSSDDDELLGLPAN